MIDTVIAVRNNISHVNCIARTWHFGEKARIRPFKAPKRLTEDLEATLENCLQVAIALEIFERFFGDLAGEIVNLRERIFPRVHEIHAAT
jgi:hypothetical protein